MPNHVTTHIEFLDPNFQSKLDTVKTDDNLFDLNKIIPMPEELDIESGTMGELGAVAIITNIFTDPPSVATPNVLQILSFTRYMGSGWFNSMKQRWLSASQEDQNKMLILGELYINNIAKYGCATWYDWRNKNWNTKWNTYEHYQTDNQLEFQTAWASPAPVIDKFMLQQQANANVKVLDEGYNFWYTQKYVNGMPQPEQHDIAAYRDCVEHFGFGDDFNDEMFILENRECFKPDDFARNAPNPDDLFEDTTDLFFNEVVWNISR